MSDRIDDKLKGSQEVSSACRQFYPTKVRHAEDLKTNDTDPELQYREHCATHREAAWITAGQRGLLGGPRLKIRSDHCNAKPLLRLPEFLLSCRSVPKSEVQFYVGDQGKKKGS